MRYVWEETAEYKKLQAIINLVFMDCREVWGVFSCVTGQDLGRATTIS